MFFGGGFLVLGTIGLNLSFSLPSYVLIPLTLIGNTVIIKI